MLPSNATQALSADPFCGGSQLNPEAQGAISPLVASPEWVTFTRQLTGQLHRGQCMGRFLRGHVWKVTHERSLGAVEETRAPSMGGWSQCGREIRGEAIEASLVSSTGVTFPHSLSVGRGVIATRAHVGPRGVAGA